MGAGQETADRAAIAEAQAARELLAAMREWRKAGKPSKR